MSMSHSVVTRYAGLWLLALVLPPAASAASMFVHVDAASWLSMSPATTRALTADALLSIAAVVVIAAPLAGVAVATSKRTRVSRVMPHALAAAWPLGVAVALYVAMSAALTMFGLGLSGNAMRFVATSHATLFTVALALAAFGALCAATFADPLDAAACSLTTVLVATGGLLVAGVAVADVPRPVIEAALTASPLVAMASAAHIDVMRMGVPYQMSPLAHLQVDYPAWYAACGWYLAFATLCFLGMRWKVRTWRATTAS
jgi:hypothetical protein